jgi:predicted dehydrogenase
MTIPLETPIHAILIGAGHRGAGSYAPYALRHPEELRFVAVAEPDRQRRERFVSQHDIPPENAYESWEALFERGKLGQAALICTPDQQHTAPAKAALRLGYDVLLEKPISARLDECRMLAHLARQLGRQLHICHVLRYTRHFQLMRQVIQSGDLGEIVDVIHRENVAFWHMAHSYVRGNWCNQGESSPMILAKCCHDLDILPWLLGQKPLRLSSSGGLIHFRPENAPPGAPAYCLDGCPAAETCPYYAPLIYVDLLPPFRSFVDSGVNFDWSAARTSPDLPPQARIFVPENPPPEHVDAYRGWPRSVVAEGASGQDLLEALRHSPYGRCVYHCDNDVVDHQVVLMEFESGLTVTLGMHGHSHIEGRTTRIQGTRAELEAFFGGPSWIVVKEHRSGRRTLYDTSTQAGDGHGGGDEALMAAFVRSVSSIAGAGGSEAGLTTIEQSLESHLMAFAAETSRLERRVVERGEWL